MEGAMPDKRWRRWLVTGVGVILVLAFLAMTAGAAGVTWTNPQVVSIGSSNVKAVDLALAGDGNPQAVWSEGTGTGKQVTVYQASASFSDGKWVWPGPDKIVEENQRGAPSLAVDSNDRLHVVYLNSDGSKVRYGLKDGTSPWTHTDIDPPAGFTIAEGTAGAPVIRIAGLTLHVVWFHKDTGVPEQYNQIVHAFSTDTGKTWQAEEVYHSPDNKHSYYPDLAIDQDGKLHVVWEEGTTASAKIYHAVGTFDGSGVSWDTPSIVSGSLTDCHRPSIAIVGNQLYVAWGQYGGSKTNQNVYYSTKSASGGAWPAPKLLPNSNVGVGDLTPTYVSPRIKATSDGRVIIVWNGYPVEGGAEAIHFTETTNIADNNAWTERSTVSSGSGISYGPAVVLEDNGVVHVMWVKVADHSTAVHTYSQYQIFLPLVLKNR